MKNLLVFCFLTAVAAHGDVKPNVCKQMKSYGKLGSGKDCYFDPDVGSNTMMIIQRERYPVESYTVTAEDGYIVTLYRMPNNGKPVFLQHGAVSSSEIFVTEGNNSIAFQLHNRGYDVWLGNNRGSFNSREHQHLPKNSKEYWNYTHDDLGNYELPAVIDFIAKKTEKRGEIIYVGHSQGTTTAMIYDLLHPKHAKENLKGFLFLGPVAFTSDMTMAFRTPLFALSDILPSLGVNHVASRNEILTELCSRNDLALRICTNLFDSIYGKSNQYAPEQIPTLISYSLMGESVKGLHQYVQMARSGKFQAYDYGARGNMILYQSKKPREYHVSEINLPVYMFGALNDYLAIVKNVIKLRDNLGSCFKKLYMYGDEKNNIHYNHVNFLFAKDNSQLFNDMCRSMDSLKDDECNH